MHMELVFKTETGGEPAMVSPHEPGSGATASTNLLAVAPCSSSSQLSSCSSLLIHLGSPTIRYASKYRLSTPSRRATIDSNTASGRTAAWDKTCGFHVTPKS